MKTQKHMMRMQEQIRRNIQEPLTQTKLVKGFHMAQKVTMHFISMFLDIQQITTIPKLFHIKPILRK